MAGRSLKGSKSLDNLKEAFAGESQANRRYLYFARIADSEGFPDVAGLSKDTADAETGHAFGHLDVLKEVGDPATGEPIGKTEKNLTASIAGETFADRLGVRQLSHVGRRRGQRCISRHQHSGPGNFSREIHLRPQLTAGPSGFSREIHL